MRIKIFGILLLVSVMNSCNNNSTTTETKVTSSTGFADTTFQKLADDFLIGYLAWRPQSAVALGFHEYDGKTTSLNKASIEGELARLKEYDQKLSVMDTGSMSAKTFYDYRILRSGIQSEIFRFEDMGSFTKNPMTYAGVIDVNIYVQRNFAPLEERIKSIIAIENKAPEIFAAARANLDDSLGKPLVETAIEVAKGSASFLSGDLVIALKDVKNDSLMASFKAANKIAVDQVNAFAEYLKKEKLPKANNHYALGEEKYKKMLLYNENITMSPDSILAIGLRELQKEQNVFNGAAKIIDPAKKPVDVYHAIQKEHPTAENLIPEAKKNLAAIKQFLTDKKIVTMPSEVAVQIQETPQYARATSTASMDTPGPFEKKATEAFYYITPVDASWTAKQKEDWLAQFDYYTTDNVTIHEVYPGHYTQFLHLNASSATKIEKIFGSYAFVEGWAHYCEKMMADEGYGHNGDSVKAAKYRLAQSGDALLRLCRLCVSIKTHCQNMPVDSATKFFMDNWYQGDKPSRQEAIRGTFDPGYLFYTIGKLEILKLRDDYQKQEGNNFSLQKFHDLVLDNGMPPIALLREVLLKDKNTWNEIL
ncbi:MAG: DUF885 domain-containing protein [Ginsengibacter sp.]